MKKISKIIGSVLITAAAVCLGIGVYQFTKEQNAGKGYQDLSEEVKKNRKNEGSKSKVEYPDRFCGAKGKESRCVCVDQYTGNGDRLSGSPKGE